MKIPLHALFDEALGLSEMTEEKDFDAMIAKLKKEIKDSGEQDTEEYKAEMEARAIEKG